MPDTHVHIAIAGAGLSGLGMAIALRGDGMDDFVVLERADDLGGTWRDNSYPGCACDIASVLYSYADEQNPSWTHAFAHQPEIQAYIRDVAARHGVTAHLRFGHEVLAADWDEEADRWQIRTSAGELTADILISAAGALADPSIPKLPEGSVWTAGGCLSWYVDEMGRNSTLWPGSVRAYQRRLARFEIGDYETELLRRLPDREPVAV